MCPRSVDFRTLRSVRDFLIPKISVGRCCPIALLHKHDTINAVNDPCLQCLFIHNSMQYRYSHPILSQLHSLLFSFRISNGLQTNLRNSDRPSVSARKTNYLQTFDWNRWPWPLVMRFMATITSETGTISFYMSIRNHPNFFIRFLLCVSEMAASRRLPRTQKERSR